MLRSVEAPNEARERLASTVEALRRPETYRGGVQTVEAIETHMSWVFLTESHAYKLKKPLRTPRMDHITVESRRRACQTELELNRRLAASVYLEVVPLVESGDRLNVGGVGSPIDWLVKMRRLPRDLMLDFCIERSSVERVLVDRLAAKLSGFYASADPLNWSDTTYRTRIVGDIDSKRTSLMQPHYGLDSAAIEAIVRAQKQWLDDHGDSLAARSGHVIDAHGDLRPEHVCLEPEPVVIDCLEFDRTLRLLDPVSELSFLALECRRLGAPWIGVLLLDGYIERTGDEPPEELIPFYQCYHALIRAAVAIWHVDDDAPGGPAHWKPKAEEYLRLARKILAEPHASFSSTSRPSV